MQFEEKLARRELRVLADLNKKKKPAEDYTEEMCQYFAYKQGADDTPPASLQAFEMRKDPFQREVLESLLLCDSTTDAIYAGIGIPPEVVHIYKHLFFDTDTAFRNRLERASYASSYSPTEKALEDKKHMKLVALNMGPESIMYTYGGVLPDAAASRVLLQKLFMSAASKAMTMQFNSIESTAAKQSTEFAKLMMKAYEILEKFAPQDTTSSTEMHHYLLMSIDTLAKGAPQVSTEDIV